jgi:FixJ family two-component response regulator
MKAEAVGFLEKPFRQNVLVNCISTAFANNRKIRTDNENIKSAHIKFDNLTARER